MSHSVEVGTPIVELAGITLDCPDPAPMAEFYSRAFGVSISDEDSEGASIYLSTGPPILFRRVENYRPPTWPAQDVPMQIHLEFWVDDLDAAQGRLRELGATLCEFQPLRDHGNLVMIDPAGHPFCIGTRTRPAQPSLQ
jgi:catechol 2,3-dioxygenase-like lactoylglutathione lyase family enzyme